MTTPSTCTWDIVPPRRPSLDDVGGGQKLDDPNPGFAPNPVTMLTAADLNQNENQISRIGGVVAHTVITVHISVGNEVIAQVASCLAAVNATPGTPFTTVHNGVGDATISWPANTFPPNVADHEAVATGSAAARAVAQTLTNSVRIRSFNAADVAVAAPFNVHIY